MEKIFLSLERIEQFKGTNSKKDLLLDLFSGVNNSDEFFRLTYNNTIYGISTRSIEKICEYNEKIDGIYFDSGDLISRKIKNSNHENKIPTIEELKDFLIKLEELSGDNALNHLKQILKYNNLAAKWITRLILKDLKLGISLISINETLKKLKKPIIEKFELQLCDKIDDVDEYSYGYPVLVGIKYDGMRGFLSKEKNKIIFTSRNGENVDYVPELIDYFKKYDDNFILDGEILCKDFSTLQKRIGRKLENIEPIEGLHFRLFDIIKFNKIDFAMKIQIERTNFIKKNFENDLTLMLEESYMVHNKEELNNIFKSACFRKEEGIVIKRLYEKYDFGSRKNWIKLKPHNDATVKVVGKKYGTGKKAGLISSLLVEDDSGKIKGYSGSGLKDDDIITIMYMDRENKLIGSFVDIRFNGITIDKFNNKSFRFARITKIRPDKNRADDLSDL